jgi:hypothetical protein
MEKLSAKLTDRLKSIRAYPVGLSADDVLRLSLTPDLAEDILKCLASSDIVDQQMALFFTDSLIRPGSIGQEQQRNLVAQIIRLSKATGKRVQAPSYKLLARFSSEVPDYRAMMLNGLENPDPMVRKEALLAYGSYCRAKEVAPLEAFENDSYVTETNMGGPLVYEIRNLALETIERVIGRTFQKSEKSEARASGEVAFWWDWTPYHAWKNRWFKRLFT